MGNVIGNGHVWIIKFYYHVALVEIWPIKFNTNEILSLSGFTGALVYKIYSLMKFYTHVVLREI